MKKMATEQKLEARFIKIRVHDWHGGRSLKLELYGCDKGGIKILTIENVLLQTRWLTIICSVLDSWSKQSSNHYSVLSSGKILLSSPPDLYQWVPANRAYSYSRCWTGTSLKWRLVRKNIIIKRLKSFAFEKTPCVSLSCKLVPVQYREYENGLLNSRSNLELVSHDSLGPYATVPWTAEL